MLARIITVLMAATLAGGLLATDAQARGGGGDHGGGFGGGHVGALGGGRVGGLVGSRVAGFGGARVDGHLGGIHMGGVGHEGRELHGFRRYSGYAPLDGGWDCSLYNWQYPRRWPYACY